MRRGLSFERSRLDKCDVGLEREGRKNREERTKAKKKSLEGRLNR